MSLGTELPPAADYRSDFGLEIEDEGLDQRAPEPPRPAKRRRAASFLTGSPRHAFIRLVRAMFGTSAADRVVRVGLASVAGSAAWLFLVHPERWEPFLYAGMALAGLTRVRWFRRRRPVAAVIKACRGVGGALGSLVPPLRKARTAWTRNPSALRMTLVALVASDALLAAVVLRRSLLVFAAVAGLNFVLLSLIPPKGEEPPEEDRVVDLRDSIAATALIGDSEAVQPAHGLLGGPSLRPFPSLNRPGWDSWESWDSLRSEETPEFQEPPSIVEKAPAPIEEPAPIVVTTPDEPLEIHPLPWFGALLRRYKTQLTIAILVMAGGLIAYAHPGPLLVPAVVVVGALAVMTSSPGRDETIRMVLAVGVVVAAIDYVSWRMGVTNWGGWWIAIPLLAAETLGAIHVVGYQMTLWPSPTPELDATEDPSMNPIYVLIPTVNEGVEVLKPTIEACLVARERYLAEFPHGRVTIVVCNDGRSARFPDWREIPALARSLGVASVSRRHQGGAKAGNIEHARRVFHINGNALLVIFDADQAPKPDFLLRTVPSFADQKVGWVQTGQYYANLGNPVSRWADDQQSMFYNLLCPGKAAHNSAFICGTNVVIRATALDQIGGLPQDSVTEDFAASISLHSDWKSVYLTDVLATGLGPLDLPSYLKQQRRWAIGTLGVFRSHWRDILIPRRGGLSPIQRVQYLLACTHYLSGIRDFVYLLCPMLFIITGTPAVRSASLGQYLGHFLPYGILSASALWYSARGVTGVRGIIMGFGSFPTLLGSLIAAIRGKKTAFAVTSKRHARQSLRYLRIYLICMAACVASIVWATQVGKRQQTSMFISVGWVVYSLIMLGAFLWLAICDIRAHSRRVLAGRPDPSTVREEYPSKLDVRPTSLRPAWNLAAAALLATPLLLGAQLKSSGILGRPAPPPFAITTSGRTQTLAGISVPAALLGHQASLVNTDIGGAPGVIGRTQDLTDHFPRQWADDLARQGGRPWITLQFGEFGPGGAPPLNASLPSIINGLDDRALGRWASEIADFRRPVYLTVLLQVDRNWAVTSGVANGGIPEDVSKAWLHIRSVFRTHHARNVAWVWAPADPLHDQQFAPSTASIGAVLQTFVNYPGTVWGDPKIELAKLERRYPGMPIFVDATVDGPSKQKAAWLARLGRAVRGDARIHALLYHEGGPSLNPTPEALKAWSADSDDASRQAWLNDLAALSAPSNSPDSIQPTSKNG